MKRYALSWLAILFLAGQMTSPHAWGAQIMTQHDRDWAAQVVSRLEKENTFPKRETPNALALLYFSNHTGRPEITPLEKGLTAMLTADLGKIKSIKLIPRGRLQALMEIMDLEVADLNDPVRMPRMGRLLGATYVLGGTLEKGQMAELEIIPQLLEVPNDILLEQPLITGDLTELPKLEKTLLEGIVAKMGIQLTPGEKQALEAPLSRNPIALNSYFRGLEQSDRGGFSAAFNLYDKALAEDPTLTLAQDAKDEMIALGIITAEGTLLERGAGLASVDSQGKMEADSSAGIGKDSPQSRNQGRAEGASDGLSRRTLLIGAGVAAAAIAVGVAASSGGDGGEDTPTDPEDPDPIEPPDPVDPPDPGEPETPRVVDTRPDNLATGIPRDLKEITFTFSTPMDNTEGSISANNEVWEINTNAVLQWSDDFEILTLRRLDEDDLSSGSEIRLILSGFTSLEGETLPDYTYTITIEEY